MEKSDIICALSTAIGESAINIIRISGEGSIEKISSMLSGCDLKNKKGNTISHAYVLDENGNKLDEVLVSVFRSPKSYTTEDMVEINTHGGAFVTSQVIELLYKNGIRPAEAGEFTKRAFLNGRIDLSQAEAVMDMITSENKKALSLANRALSGETKTLIQSLRKEIEEILLHITVNIDYPEYTDELQVTNDLCISNTTSLISKLESIISVAENNRVYKEGVKTVILGKPNVGKSSLLNALLKEDKAIVTSISGTTRDIVEGRINVGGITLHLIDTAGIRATDDVIEKIGIEKSLKMLDEAELVLLITDESQNLDDSDMDLLKKTENKKRIIIRNKSDIKSSDSTQLEGIEISALNKTGINELTSRIKEMFINENIAEYGDLVISSARQISILKKALESLRSACQNAKSGEFIDMIEIDLRDAYSSLGEIIGEGSPDELIDELFKNFCLGK